MLLDIFDPFKIVAMSITTFIKDALQYAIDTNGNYAVDTNGDYATGSN